MATYAISDVHGCFDQLQELLDLISPAESDEVWMMGDVLDRGPKSVEALEWAVSAPECFHFLLGNHEDMAREVVLRSPKHLPFLLGDTWMLGANGGRKTRKKLLSSTASDWREEKLAPWLEGLLPWAYVEVGDREIMLVHAGFDPWRFASDDGETPKEGEVLPDGHEAKIGHGFGTQSIDDMVWIRFGWFDRPEAPPMEVVFGHTPTLNLPTVLASSPSEVVKASEGAEQGRIWHCLGRHDIDCGCYAGGRLAALRLVDMEEFYVEGLQDRWR